VIDDPLSLRLKKWHHDLLNQYPDIAANATDYLWQLECELRMAEGEQRQKRAERDGLPAGWSYRLQPLADLINNETGGDAA